MSIIMMQKFIYTYTYIYNCRACSKEDWERPEQFANHPQYNINWRYDI
jgi:hypothetical protein